MFTSQSFETWYFPWPPAPPSSLLKNPGQFPKDQNQVSLHMSSTLRSVNLQVLLGLKFFEAESKSGKKRETNEKQSSRKALLLQSNIGSSCKCSLKHFIERPGSINFPKRSVLMAQRRGFWGPSTCFFAQCFS